MNILIVYCHPSKKSYTYQVFEHLKTVLMDQHWSLEVSDLYEMGFQSDLSENEYEREGLAKTAIPIPSDVLAEHKKIDHADGIIIVYPVYPAREGQVKFWRIYFFDLQGAKRRRSQSYGEHLQRGRVKKERDKNHLDFPRGVCRGATVPPN